jgi:protein-tyrosine phosphatase
MAAPATDAHRFAPAAPGEEFVFGACAPGWHAGGDHATALRAWLDTLDRAGIERVVCLVPGRRLDADDHNVGRYRETFGAEHVLHAPVPDHRLVDAALLEADVLPFLDRAVEERSPVVVHCLTGLGRTGQVLAAWLVHGRDYPPHEAVRTVREMGREPREPVTRGNATDGDLLALLDGLRE